MSPKGRKTEQRGIESISYVSSPWRSYLARNDSLPGAAGLFDRASRSKNENFFGIVIMVQKS